MVPRSEEPSPVLVRSLALHSGVEIPSHFLVLCPHWLTRLRWRPHPDNWLVYIDAAGRMIARITWWRDGGPLDVQEDAFWGEEIVILVTPDGRKQLESQFGTLTYAAAARCVVPPEVRGTENSRTAHQIV